MDSMRRIALVVLFGAAFSVLGLALGLWVLREGLRFDAQNSGLENALTVGACATALFLTMYLTRLTLGSVLRWALAHKYHRVLRFMERFAPVMTRSVLGAVVGTSLSLAGNTAASATIPTARVELPLKYAEPATDNAFPGADTIADVKTQQLPLPTWSPGVVNISMPRLIGSGQHEPPSKTPSKNRNTTQEVVVTQGQSLWSIARDFLGPQATIAEISEFWPRIYEQNRTSIGPNPDVLRLGTVVLIPSQG